MIIDIKNPDSPYKGLWLYKEGYFLCEDLFTPEIKKSVLIQTGLKSIDGGDWWTFAKSKDFEMSWKQLIEFSLKILNSELTRLICNSLWLDTIPEDEIKDILPIDLPNHNLMQNKKINLSCAWYDENQKKKVMLEKFKLFGKETNDKCEGTWLHWVSFATKILADTNTAKCCLRLQCVQLAFKVD